MKPTPTQIEALELCQKALSMMITPAQIDQTSTLQAFAIATEAEAKARAALAAAVVGEPEPIGYCSEYGLDKLASKAHHYCLSVSKAQENEFQFPIYAAHSAPEGWQPIDTAPKDGRKILAFARGVYSRDNFYGVAQWAEADTDFENAVSCWFWSFAVRPTHWRPLPAPPALGEKP